MASARLVRRKRRRAGTREGVRIPKSRQTITTARFCPRSSRHAQVTDTTRPPTRRDHQNPQLAEPFSSCTIITLRIF